MTIENDRQDNMLIGHHFGKRKPQWNFFIRSYERFKFSTSAPLVRLVAFSFLVQMAFYTPVIYWIYQNYAIIEKVLPAHLNLQENIQFEKKWIVFLMFGMTLIQGFWNYYLWKVFIRSERYHLPEDINLESVASPDEVDYRRRAS